VLDWTFLLEFVPIIAAIYLYVQWPSAIEASGSRFPGHDRRSTAKAAKFRQAVFTLAHGRTCGGEDKQ
jgi:hypothetical protein